MVPLYSESVFEKALSENKPILISIGYSTCHWCHVMAHECFENIQIAKQMNEYLICIKVDREELPENKSFVLLLSSSRGIIWTFTFLKKQYYESTEITITGKEAAVFFQKIFPQSWFLNTIYTSNNSCHYSVFQNRVHPQKTFIYVCRHSAYYEPLESPDMFDIWPYLDHERTTAT